MLLIGVAGDSPQAAIGVGGSIVVLGIAFIVIGEINRRSQPTTPQTGSAPPAPFTPPTHPAE
jgi:hypothetical protein